MRVVFSITAKSTSGLSVYRDFGRLSRDTVEDFLPPPERLAEIVGTYRAAGFRVEAETAAGCTLSGETDLFQRVFGTEVAVGRVPYIQAFRRSVHQTPAPLAPPLAADLIERVVFPKPSFELDAPAPTPPPLGYYHMRAGDLRRISDPAGRLGPDRLGEGVAATVVDTGAYPHPYFRAAGADLTVLPAVSDFDPARDERGHGTGMTSVFLSQAPRASVSVVKMAATDFSFALPAFQRAVGCPGRLISCSWGTIGFEPQLYLEIANAVRLGKIVVFSSGNGSVDTRAGFFASISSPDIISVGGCFVTETGDLRLSDVSSCFASDLFPGRSCPDVLGVCGLKPFGQWILMPCEPGSIYDRDNGERDGTDQDDGWFVSSGTSAAAAYVSGLIALGLQIAPEMPLDRVKALLFESARPVTAGESNMKIKATAATPDLATGHGFVDVGFVDAVLAAYPGKASTQPV